MPTNSGGTHSAALLWKKELTVGGLVANDVSSELNIVQSLNDSSFCWELSTKIFIDFQVSLLKSEFQL